ncbi:MAG: phosphoribosylamine--glycine ligase [Candidatus Aminicenantia bacterium]
MKVMVVGGGGREHALVWKLSRSPLVDEIIAAPGNAGIAEIAKTFPINVADIVSLADLALEEGVNFTIVGPELPLTLGIVDEFERKGLRIFGPNKNAAEIEGSKVFAKEFMKRYKIPTAKYIIANSAVEAEGIINSGLFDFPLVIKADGLTGGKGSIICKDLTEAESSINLIMKDRVFGVAGARIIIEEFLKGEEITFMVLTDGHYAIPLASSMDYKKVFDGDQGPNTGGMGAISPCPSINRTITKEIMEKVIIPTLEGLKNEDRKFKGILYAGLMLTKKGVKVLEFNCRFGDPETQAVLLRLESDLLELLLSVEKGDLKNSKPKWSKKPSACVVIASRGYPENYETGKVITGLENLHRFPGIVAFHAGTKRVDDKIVTSGGRVLGICSTGATLASCMNSIYNAIENISFDGMIYRHDIGRKVSE